MSDPFTDFQRRIYRQRPVAVRLVLILLVAIPMVTAGCASALDSCGFESRELSAGDEASFYCGLDVRLSDGTRGSMIRYETDPPEDLHHLADKAEITETVAQGEREIVVTSFWQEEGALTLTGVKRWQVAAVSTDGSVEVRGLPSASSPGDQGKVAVVTRLPGKKTGLVMELGIEVRTAREALEQAERIWASLSLQGADLPSR